MLNFHGVAATLAAGSVLALLADKGPWALVYLAAALLAELMAWVR